MGNELNTNEFLRHALESGKYPIADEKLFKVFSDRFYLTDYIKGEIEYFLETYEEYYQKILEFDNEVVLNNFLKEGKNWDIANNQSIEGESLAKIDEARKKIDKTAIDRLIDLKDKNITKDDFVDIHNVLLIGTSIENQKGFRMNDNYFVGTSDDNNNIIIRWFPALIKNLDRLTNKYIENLNNREFKDDYERVIRPILFNIVLTGLQLFKDGNTRYARLFQTVKLWENLDGSVTKDMKLPILYPSVQIYPYRDQAREVVGNIITNPDDEKNWINALRFHLHRLHEANYMAYENGCKKVRRLMR